MSIKSVVNTNISSVTDPNGLRGELSSSVYAFDMGRAADGAGNAQTFGAGVLIAGTEKVGAYQGDVQAGTAAAGGAFQVITMTFANEHGWTAAKHYGEVSFIAGTNAGAAVNQTDALSAGTGQVSFASATSITIKRQCGAVNGVAAQNLTEATMVVRIRKRGVEQA